MEITDVRIRKVTGGGKLKAFVSITIDEIFVVHDLKIIEGDKGVFVAMPSRKTPSGEFRDTAHPIKTECRRMIQGAVLAKYREMYPGELSEDSEGVTFLVPGSPAKPADKRPGPVPSGTDDGRSGPAAGGGDSDFSPF